MGADAELSAVPRWALGVPARCQLGAGKGIADVPSGSEMDSLGQGGALAEPGLESHLSDSVTLNLLHHLYLFPK